MELHSEDNGETISVNHTTTTTLGRSNHPSNNDLTVSRNHVSLKLTPQSTALTFEVVGKNPILVLTSGGKKKVCGRGEKGELREGDRMSLSIQSPSLWVVRREVVVESSILEAVKRRERRTLERRMQRENEELKEEFDLESEEESLDFSNIDPVQEFGFLVAGHEFDKYPKGKVLPMKKWNWYLDAPKQNSDSDIDITEEPNTSRSKSSSTRKKRGKEGEDDEDWTGESDQEKDLIAKNATGLKRSKYSMRSKDSKMSRNEIVEDDDDSVVQNDEDDGEDDETLGGFIVTGDDEDQDEEMDNREEEEEEEEDFEDEELDD